MWFGLGFYKPGCFTQDRCKIVRLSDKEECSTWSVRHGNGKQDTRFVLTESVSLISLSAFFFFCFVVFCIKNMVSFVCP